MGKYNILEWVGFAVCLIAILIGGILRNKTTDNVNIDIILIILGVLITLVGVILRVRKKKDIKKSI
ncbi:hypothetical protein [Psychrobacillus sp. BM2]|uniref:hypothetical protein n=1 Tax=Psychrobacillus sp. BM2 TaxID=3400421 RepID=UPI003B011E43